MRSAVSFLAGTRLLLSILALLPSTSFAKKDGPEITSTSFDHPLENIFYFDDSNVILAQDPEAYLVYRSEDAGSTWKPIDKMGQDGHSWDLWAHPFDNQRAYIIGDRATHWMTKDQGKTWDKFNPGSEANYGKTSPLTFHGRDPKKVIWNGLDCVGLSCEEVASYTEDDFKTVKDLAKDTRGCYWAVGTPMFGEEIAKVVDDRIFCVKAGQYSPWLKDNRLVVSDDHFRGQEIEPALDGERAVTGIINMAAVKNYLVAAAKSEGTDELALYVSDDSSTWHRAIFGKHRVSEGAYTILESTNYSMQVDVMGSRPMNPMGHLFTSNSNGTFFTRNIDYTNRNIYGRVDFEKVANIQGIVLVNVVTNHEEVEKSSMAEKKIISRISFDDGRTFQDLMAEGKKLHLHSVTEARQGGRIFSSPAPGIVMGVGNIGASLKAYNDGDLFVSDDAGVTWTRALDGAHLYEFGNNGAILVAVDNEQPTDTVRYSLDHGKKWKKAKLEKEITARFLTTVPDSTTLSFLLGGTTEKNPNGAATIFKIDFEGLHERKCGDKDFEKWPARVNDKGEASCIMGHKQFFRRRLADADCVIDDDFKDPVPEFEPCVCTEDDFECDFDFTRDPGDRSKCNPSTPIKVPEGTCKDSKGTFKGPSGWRLIPGNACIRKGGDELDKEIERPCSESAKEPVYNDQIAVEKTKFDADQFMEWIYLERSDTSLGDDETIVMRTSKQEIFITHDHGKTWARILKDEAILSIVPNPHEHDAIFFLTRGRTVHYTINRGETFHSFEAKERPSANGLPVLKFHPDYKDWILWSGSPGQREDATNVYYSQDRGDSWKTLARAASKCDFIYRKERDQLIYCKQFKDENPSTHVSQLLSSENWFGKTETVFTSILDYATMAEFIIVAARTEDQKSLKVDASVDGVEFAEAEFPRGFIVDHQQAYTVLDSSTHAVFLHVTVDPEKDREYGTIIKSNSNGTSYVLTLNGVNRDGVGYVDFEKMLGLEGVAMVNIVSNIDGLARDEKKKLKSMITHNDGAHWAYLPPPKLNSDRQAYPCVRNGDSLEKCSLHLHSYTERFDKSATFSSPTAVGLMIAVGNVGEQLLPKDSVDTETFITRDAGVTWKAIRRGSFKWEYGDQGSIIVVVNDPPTPTRWLYYSLDEGETWPQFEFSDVEMTIDSITTVPSDNSRNFILWGRETEGGDKRITTVNLDFSGLKSRQRQCKLDEENPGRDDYELWEPKHPSQQDNCLFGHVAQYHRKKTDADCYNGRKITHLHNIARNCSCTREDFECDYNYEMQSDGTCQLVPGLSPPSHAENCAANPSQIEFYYPTGYRKIPLSTCQGGRDLEKIEAVPCPGHEKEFNEKHGLSAAGLLFAIAIPLAAAAGVGYWAYKRYQERGFGGFGAIRLGESMGGSSSGSGQSPLIAIPVTIIAGTVAVLKALPLLVTSLFRSLRGYVPIGNGGSGGGFGRGRGAGGYGGSGPYRSRDSFANRRDQTFADQAYVEDDELLGDDEEVEGDDV